MVALQPHLQEVLLAVASPRWPECRQCQQALQTQPLAVCQLWDIFIYEISHSQSCAQQALQGLGLYQLLCSIDVQLSHTEDEQQPRQQDQGRHREVKHHSDLSQTLLFKLCIQFLQLYNTIMYTVNIFHTSRN